MLPGGTPLPKGAFVSVGIALQADVIIILHQSEKVDSPSEVS